MPDIDDLFYDPNGPAYVKREERVGPPLSYVAEKLLMTPDTAGRLLQMTDDELEDWLDGVEREGVVSENS